MLLFKNVTLCLHKLLLFGVPYLRFEVWWWQQDANQMISLLRVLVEYYSQKLFGLRILPKLTMNVCVILSEIVALFEWVRRQIYVGNLLHFLGKIVIQFVFTLLECLEQLLRIGWPNEIGLGASDGIVVLQKRDAVHCIPSYLKSFMNCLIRAIFIDHSTCIHSTQCVK